MNNIEPTAGHEGEYLGTELDSSAPPMLQGPIQMALPKRAQNDENHSLPVSSQEAVASIPHVEGGTEEEVSMEMQGMQDVEQHSLWERIKEWVRSFVGKEISQTKDEIQVECKRRSCMEKKLQRLQADIKKIRERLEAIESLCFTSEQLRTHMTETIKVVEGDIGKLRADVVALKQSQVMAAAERKNTYDRFICCLLSLIDLIYDKLKQNQAKTLTDGFSRKLFDMVSGAIDSNEFICYIDMLKSPEELQTHGVAPSDSWQNDMEEIKQEARSVESVLPDIDTLTKEFDKYDRFVDLLIFPSKGDDFDPLTMRSRVVGPGDEALYVVESVHKIGINRNHANPEITKALVSVSARPKSDAISVPNH